MFNKSNGFSRRILSFPAIRPCESVSSSTLLASLISLGHRICGFKLRIFFTNKRNVRNSIGLIETLVIFLEELRSANVDFEASTALCLSELHIVLQKVQFLLEDCSRDDARLWMLLKSEKVCSHLRVLMRGIAVALDVLPLSGLDVEVVDLVDFVRKRAMKANFEMEKDAVRAVVRVRGILNQVEGGIAPETNDFRIVLAQLRISTWVECNREVKFLEREIGQEYCTTERKELGFLTSLLAFMVYCRCTLFVSVKTVNHDACHQFGGGAENEAIRCLNADDFRCPITLEIMVDPVTISTGHTYDRSSILKWFRSGHHTCPKTGKKLICTDLVPNHALKQLIKQYGYENGAQVTEYSGAQSHDVMRLSIDSGCVVAEQAMALLSTFLVCRLVEGSTEEQNKAAYEIRLLTKTSVFNRSCLVEADAIPPLLDLLCSNNPGAQENAMAALLNLSKYPKSKAIIVANGGLELIVHALTSGLKAEASQHAAGALFYITSVEEYQRMVGRIPSAIPGLMDLLKNGTDGGKKNALATILSLIMDRENHWRMLSGGLVLLLVTLLKTFTREDHITLSLAILATLAEKLDGTMAITDAGILPVVVKILSSSNSRTTREHCISLLLSVCTNNGVDVVPVLVQTPSLIASLYSSITDGTPRASRKASSLIRILHAFNEKQAMASASALPQEHHVHVW